MILATHAIVGAAAGRLFLDPFIAFAAGFASHFLADAIPHWDYHLKSFDPKESGAENKIFTMELASDAARFLPDLILGALAAIFIFQGNDIFYISVSLIAGIIGGVLPDALEIICLKLRIKCLSALSAFHNFVHYKNRPGPFLGLLSQVVAIIVAVVLSKLIE